MAYTRQHLEVYTATDEFEDIKVWDDRGGGHREAAGGPFHSFA